MQFNPASLNGAYTVELEVRSDSRGFFARSFCEREFEENGLESRFRQINNSLGLCKGTMRGLHYQLAPAAEVKLVRCIRGAIYDLIADLRPDSSTFGQTFGAELSAENRTMMYVPRGCAHGMLTLVDNTEVIYLASDFYAPDLERGLRFDDPRLEIDWPLRPVDVSDKDRNWPLFDLDYHGIEQLRGLL